MKELNNELHRHYGLHLGVKSPWEVDGVNLDMEGRRVEIRLELGHGTRRAVSGMRQGMHDGRPCAGADVAAFGHDAV